MPTRPVAVRTLLITANGPLQTQGNPHVRWKRKQVKKALDGNMVAVNSVLGSRERYVDGHTASFQTNR
jgi:hypothetical protein